MGLSPGRMPLLGYVLSFVSSDSSSADSDTYRRTWVKDLKIWMGTHEDGKKSCDSELSGKYIK